MDSFILDDGYLTSLISVCSELAQTYTNRALTPATVTQIFSGQTTMTLWGGEVETVTSVKDAEGIELEFTFNKVLQQIQVDSDYAEVLYDCGYATVPSPVKAGVLLMIASMYLMREDVVMGSSVDNLPLSSTVVLNSVRIMR